MSRRQSLHTTPPIGWSPIESDPGPTSLEEREVRSLERQVAKYLSASHGHLPSPPRPLSDMRFQRLAGSIHGLALRAYKAERSSAARHEDTGLEQLQAFISESNADLRRNMQDALQGVRNDINSLARIVASFDFHSARVAEQAEDTDRAATTGILLDEQQPASDPETNAQTFQSQRGSRASDTQADRGAGGDLSTGNRDSAETRDFRGTGDARSSSHEVAQFVQHSEFETSPGHQAGPSTSTTQHQQQQRRPRAMKDRIDGGSPAMDDLLPEINSFARKLATTATSPTSTHPTVEAVTPDRQRDPVPTSARRPPALPIRPPHSTAKTLDEDVPPHSSPTGGDNVSVKQGVVAHSSSDKTRENTDQPDNADPAPQQPPKNPTALTVVIPTIASTSNYHLAPDSAWGEHTTPGATSSLAERTGDGAEGAASSSTSGAKRMNHRENHRQFKEKINKYRNSWPPPRSEIKEERREMWESKRRDRSGAGSGSGGGSQGRGGGRGEHQEYASQPRSMNVGGGVEPVQMSEHVEPEKTLTFGPPQNAWNERS